MEIYYLSFAGNEGVRGVCLVEANGAVEAVRTAHRLGINPGGEAMIAHISRETYDQSAPRQLPFNRLMDKETLIRLGGPVRKLDGEEES